MRFELEQKLAEKYPFMRREKTVAEQQAEAGHVYNTFWAYGYEHGDGWYDLLCEMCEEIVAAYRNADEPIDITVEQVKEKFGTLRFYYSVAGGSMPLIIDFFGMGTLRSAPVAKTVHREVAEIVRRYEEKSETVCEKCGRPGVLRKDLPWILTLCDDCYEKRKSADPVRYRYVCAKCGKSLRWHTEPLPQTPMSKCPENPSGDHIWCKED